MAKRGTKCERCAEASELGLTRSISDRQCCKEWAWGDVPVVQGYMRSTISCLFSWYSYLSTSDSRVQFESTHGTSNINFDKSPFSPRRHAPQFYQGFAPSYPIWNIIRAILLLGSVGGMSTVGHSVTSFRLGALLEGYVYEVDRLVLWKPPRNQLLSYVEVRRELTGGPYKPIERSPHLRRTRLLREMAYPSASLLHGLGGGAPDMGRRRYVLHSPPNALAKLAQEVLDILVGNRRDWIRGECGVNGRDLGLHISSCATMQEQ